MKKLPRGFKNNNPLNIRKSLSNWVGKARDQTDKSFVVFKEMVYGYRAAWIILKTYKRRLDGEMKPLSIYNIIRRWAPPKENDTEAYIRHVVKLTGFDAHRVLSAPEAKGDDLMKVIVAMTCVENGIDISLVPRNDIRRAYFMVYPDGWLTKEI